MDDRFETKRVGSYFHSLSKELTFQEGTTFSFLIPNQKEVNVKMLQNKSYGLFKYWGCNTINY